MSSSFDKIVKLACKPKAAPPKAKYVDPIIAATYSEDGAVHDVCKALAPRLREPNSIVVFKALIVLHTMIRNGATDNVLGYLSSDDVLRLRGVSAGHWEGYDTPRNLQNYAIYLDTRIRTYKDLKHDPVRVQSDQNRDARVDSQLGRDSLGGGRGGPQRSKTVMGRKLRSMTVEKGLLRETKAVQRAMASLVECQFFYDNLDDELNVTALRMLVKDLLILFQALNEGVVNVLEHYFEMSHVDAETSLSIYRNFCKQTERAVEFLGIARKLQNLLNVPIPNLKLAPVSLVSALEEYLNDPNFEQNRIEYKTTKAMADKNVREGKRTKSVEPANKGQASSTSKEEKPSSSSTSLPLPKGTENNQALVDFFSSIEEEQPLQLVAQSHSQIQQQQAQFQQPMPTGHNPFAMRQSMMMTGAFPQQPFGQPQANGFMQPQQTGFMPTSQPTGLPPSHHPSFSSFLQPQAPQPTGFLQPQTTGANPFRQSMLMPQSTGMPPFATGGMQQPANGSLFPGPSFAAPQPTGQSPFPQNQPFGPTPMSNATSSPAPAFNASQVQQQLLPQRPASTPLANPVNAFGQPTKVVSHQTGSKNPFGIPQESPPPLPKAPTLQELRTGAAPQPTGMFGQHNQNGAQPPSNQQGSSPFRANFGQSSSPAPTSAANGSIMANVASSFSTTNNNAFGNENKAQSELGGTPSISTQFTSTSAFSSQPTGSTGATSAFSAPLQPQTTGFSGLKQFKPTSSFGASLLDSLPPIPQSSPATPSGTSSPPLGTNNNPGTSGPSLSSLGTSLSSPLGGGQTLPSFGSSNFNATGNANSGLGALNAQPTGGNALGNGSGSNFGSNIGVGLRPQMTGSGVANPFRASMFNQSPTGMSGVPPLPQSQFGGGQIGTNPTGAPSFGSSMFQSFGLIGQQNQQQQQQPAQTGSLI